MGLHGSPGSNIVRGGAFIVSILCYRYDYNGGKQIESVIASSGELGGDRIPRAMRSDRFDLGGDSPSECEVSQ